MSVYKSGKLVQGIGVNDADYPIIVSEYLGKVDGKKKYRKIWSCPFYTRWCGVLERCNPLNQKGSLASYLGTDLCEDWKYFSKFKAWMETQDWEGKQLDKDILFRGNRTYSPETCRFVPQYLNKLLTAAEAGRGDWPLGVSFRKDNGMFVAAIKTRLKTKSSKDYLGQFKTATEAHRAWQREKISRILEYVAIYKEDQTYLQEVVDSLLLRVELLQHDIINNLETKIL